MRKAYKIPPPKEVPVLSVVEVAAQEKSLRMAAGLGGFYDCGVSNPGEGTQHAGWVRGKPPGISKEHEKSWLERFLLRKKYSNHKK